MAYRRTVGPSIVRMPSGVVASIYDQQSAPIPSEFGVAPRSVVIQSQSGHIPLDSDSDEDLRYGVV